MFDRTVVHDDLVIVGREQYSELIRKSERIEAVKRLYESGNCYTLDTALAALGIKLRGSERVALSDRMSGDPCEDDLK